MNSAKKFLHAKKRTKERFFSEVKNLVVSPLFSEKKILVEPQNSFPTNTFCQKIRKHTFMNPNFHNLPGPLSGKVDLEFSLTNSEHTSKQKNNNVNT